MKKIFLSLFLCATLTVSAQDQANAAAQLAEKIFGYVVKNQADSLYFHLTRQLKLITSKEQMEGILQKAEEHHGKYKSHGQWKVTEMSGSKTCTATVQFEKEELGALIVLDPSNFLMGVQIVPAHAIKKD